MSLCKRGIAVFLAVALFFSVALCSVSAANPDSKTIRIGSYYHAGFMQQAQAGDYIGYVPEFLQELAKYSGWSYEYVTYADWESAYNALIAGEVDLMGALYRSPEREELLDFPELSMGVSYVALCAGIDDTRYNFEDFESFNGMRVGSIENTKNVDVFNDYCKANKIAVDMIYYAENSEMLEALDRKEIDGVAVSNLGKTVPLRTLAKFSPEAFYLATTKGNSELLSTLDQALSNLKLRNPYFEATLYEKYFAVTAEQNPVFTKEEQAYIDSAPPIKCVYDPYWKPLDYYDAETQSKNSGFSGVSADLFEQISRSTGLKFEFIKAESYTDALRIVNRADVDILTTIVKDYRWAATNNLNATDSYLHSPVAMIRRKGSSEDSRVALPKGYATTEQLAEKDKGKEIIYFDTIEECFRALCDDKADITYVNTYISDYLLSGPAFRSLSATTLAEFTDEICIGISKSADPLMITILDKALEYISSEQLNEMVIKNSAMIASATWNDFLRENIALVIVLCCVASILIIGALAYALWMKSRSRKKIKDLLYQDPLTGGWNLNKFRIEAAARLAKAPKNTFALIYADINQFKTINDTFGFAEGDRLLKIFHEVILQNISDDECSARVSADQFVILLHYNTWEELQERTKKIDDIMNLLPQLLTKAYHIVITFGAYIVTNEVKNVALMLDLANYARQSGKASHKSTIILYDEQMRKSELQQRDLTNVMEQALKNGEFVPFFQAKVDMFTGKLVGSEALVRWVHPQGDIIPPGRFIPHFEKNGFITEIDLSVYRQVCENIRRWMDEGKTIKPVSCNFSRLHMQNPDFANLLKAIADEHGVPTEYLELEITESVAMEDLNRIRSFLDQLKEKGFIISIDDFGSGYSSLGLLQQLNVDVLKLDRSFLHNGVADERERVIIEGIVNVVHKLHMTIICEGVETCQQAKMLMQLGCPLAQGFLYAKPVPAAEFEKVLALLTIEPHEETDIA